MILMGNRRFTQVIISKGRRTEFEMKYHIFHNFTTSTPSKQKSSHHFKDLQKLKLLTNFNVNLTSSVEGPMN